MRRLPSDPLPLLRLGGEEKQGREEGDDRRGPLVGLSGKAGFGRAPSAVLARCWAGRWAEARAMVRARGRALSGPGQASWAGRAGARAGVREAAKQAELGRLG